MLPLDTTPDAVDAQTEAHRRLGPAGRAALAIELSETVRELARTGIRLRHPEYTERQVAAALVFLLHGVTLPQP